MAAYAANRGLDITDEAYYLLWAAKPDAVTGSITQFGYYTRFLLMLSGDNVQWFRIIGILVMLSATTVLGYSINSYLNANSISDSRNFSLSIPMMALLVASYTYYFNLWLLTPSYNWMTLCGISLAGGMLLRMLNLSSASGFSLTIIGVILGFGGAICFLAKPPSAMILALLCLIPLLFGPVSQRPKRFLILMTAVVVAALILFIHIWIVLGGFDRYLSLVTEGFKRASMVGAGHGSSDLILELLTGLGYVLIGCFLLAIPVFGIVWKGRMASGSQAQLVAESWVGVLILLYVLLWVFFVDFQLNRKLALLAWVVPCISILYVFMESRLIALESSLHAPNGVFPAIEFLILLFLPVCFAFGSSNQLLSQTSGSGALMLAPSIFAAEIIRRHYHKYFLSGTIHLFILVVVVLFLVNGWKHPYRLPASVSEQNYPAEFLSPLVNHRVDKQSGEYVRDLSQVASKSGWRPGNALIDLTGASPGAILLLGGRFIGTPWLLGGYGGSESYVEYILAQSNRAELLEAWVLTSDGSERSINSEVLNRLGLNFPDRYKLVGNVQNGYRNEAQNLWKPISH